MSIAKELIRDKELILESIISRVLNGIQEPKQSYESIDLLTKQITILKGM